MKKLIIILITLLLISAAYAADQKIIRKNNEYGGITEQFTLNPDEKDYEQFSSVINYYDNINILQKRKYILSKKLQEETEILEQDEYYKDGLLSEYHMILTEAAFYEEGITEVIEILNPDGSTKEIGHSNGKFTAYASANSFVNKYPLYRLSYLDHEYFSEAPNRKDDGKDHYYLSAKYYRARSFVNFNSDFSVLNDFDKKLIDFFADYMENPEITSLYTSKTTVKSEDSEYTVYMQQTLQPYIQKDMDCLLVYGVMGCNEKLFLFATEFEEVTKK